jgi:glycosyltransferase involved in cell wall biosynthesis
MPAVTVVIPTRNRSGFLRASLASVLEQEHEDVTVEAHDNASTDDTAEVVRSFADPRVRYRRRPVDVGLYRNWNEALSSVRTAYVSVLQDDDVLLPGFLRRSVRSLEAHRNAGMSFSDVAIIDEQGTRQEPQRNDLPGGLVDGSHYLHRIVAGENLVIHVSSVLMRTDALRAVGTFDVLHQTHAFEFNLYFRLASRYDLVHVPDILAEIRHHSNQGHRRTSGGAIGMTADRTDAVGYLLTADQAGDAAYRRWLSERLLSISKLRSSYTAEVVSDVTLAPSVRLDVALEELARSVESGAQLVLVDQGMLDDERWSRWRVRPFLDHDGRYGGPPADDDEAIAALQALREEGAAYLVTAWPAFWWLDYYTGFREFLHARFPRVLDTSRLVIFDLRREVAGAGVRDA